MISYFKLRLKLGVEEGADGPGPLDLGLRKRMRDVVGPVDDHELFGGTPERIIESPLRFSRSVGVLVAVNHQTGALHISKIDGELRQSCPVDALRVRGQCRASECIGVLRGNTTREVEVRRAIF